jgi:hypothetical protein
MPIIDRVPKRAFDQFEHHIEGMVRAVLPMPSGVKFSLWSSGHKHKATLSFVIGASSLRTAVPLETKIGTLFLSIEQDLLAERSGRGFRVRTERYGYRLAASDEGRAKSLIRWEYRRDIGRQRECRNHLHIAAAVPAGDGALLVDKVHVPTGWVLIEDVLRFLIHDLEVTPRTQDWARMLSTSETKFFEDFTTKRHKHRPEEDG